MLLPVSQLRLGGFAAFGQGGLQGLNLFAGLLQLVLQGRQLFVYLGAVCFGHLVGRGLPLGQGLQLLLQLVQPCLQGMDLFGKHCGVSRWRACVSGGNGILRQLFGNLFQLAVEIIAQALFQRAQVGVLDAGGADRWPVQAVLQVVPVAQPAQGSGAEQQAKKAGQGAFFDDVHRRLGAFRQAFGDQHGLVRWVRVAGIVSMVVCAFSAFAGAGG